MDECELIAFVSAVACAITKCCTTDDINLLSVIFTQLGDSLQTALAQRDRNSKGCDTENDPDGDNKADC